MKWAKLNNSVIDFRVENLRIQPPLDAAKNAINLIQKEYPPPYYLMVSGGVDSQAMLYSWLLFGTDYIPVSIIYNDIFNLHDLIQIQQFSSLHTLSINYINFDLLNFLTNEYNTFSEKIRCSSPCISAHVKMVEHLKGTVIFSGDPLNIRGATLTDAILGLYRASIQQKNIIPYFFLHTPELAYSFIYKKNDEKYFNSLNDYGKKIYMYHESEFPVIPQLQKTSGFEKVKDYYDLRFWHSVPYNNRLKYSTKPSKRTFDLLYRYPYEEKYKDQKITFLMNNLG